jgi:ATP-dependent exoDNAse (exonuclease V) alpha subunit
VAGIVEGFWKRLSAAFDDKCQTSHFIILMPLMQNPNAANAKTKATQSVSTQGGGANNSAGFVTKVESEEGELTASFDGRSVTYSFGELDTLVPAYAATIHKSQGSEYAA